MRLPIGGHHFKTDRPLVSTLKSDTLDDLVEQLKDFRLNNGVPVGDPLQDILAYYKENWPYLVVEEPGDTEDVGMRYSIWRSWIYKTWKNPPKNLIPVKMAKERWAICENCPHNKPINWTDSEESQELKRRAFMLRRGIDVPNYLGYCKFHGVDLGVFDLLDKPALFVLSEGQSKECWLEKLKDNDGFAGN